MGGAKRIWVVNAVLGFDLFWGVLDWARFESIWLDLVRFASICFDFLRFGPDLMRFEKGCFCGGFQILGWVSETG